MTPSSDRAKPPIDHHDFAAGNKITEAAALEYALVPEERACERHRNTHRSASSK